MKLQIQSYKEKNPNLKINKTGELIGRTRIYKVGDVLSFICEGTKDLVKIIIAEEFKCEGENKSLLISKKIQIISGHILIKEIIGPKQYILKGIAETKAPIIQNYANDDMFEIYNFEYINDLVIEASKLLEYLENIKISDSNIDSIYNQIKNDFSIIIKILNNIGCFEKISKSMLAFLFFFSNTHEKLNLEEKIEKISITLLFLRDFAKIFHKFEEEIHGGINIAEDINHINGENEIDKIIQKYTGLIQGSIEQTVYSLDIIINPDNTNYEQQKIEFF